MGRFNLFKFFILMAYNVSFCTSPIDKHRFDEEFEQRVEANKLLPSSSSIEEEDCEDLFEWHTTNNGDEAWYWKLLDPSNVGKMIKRYHMVSSRFFLLFFGHFLLLVHFTTKCLVHTFYTGSDPVKIEFFKSIYYPHLASVLPEPYLFNNLFLAMSIYNLIARLLSAYRLIENSIVNADKYERLWISQINFSVLPICDFTFYEWISLFTHCCKHEHLIKNNQEAKGAHLAIRQTTLENLDNLSRRDLLFYVNAFDFNECFQETGFFPDLERRGPSYRSWHIALPAVRISSGIVRETFQWFALAVVFLCFFALTVLVGMVYLELRSAFPADYEAKSIEVLSVWREHLSEPFHLLRLIEFVLLTFLQIPQQIDALLAVTDQVILISRVRRAISIFQHEWDGYLSKSPTWLRQRRQRRHRIHSDSPRSFYRVVHDNYSFADTCHDDSKAMPEIRQLNYKLQHYVKLVGLLNDEFRNIKKAHTPLMNLIVVGNGFCLAYAISLLLTVQGWPQYILLSVIIVFCLAPTIDALIFSAYIEKYLRELYWVMGRFLIDEQKFLEVETIKMIRLGSEAFELLNNRSISIFGLYFITLDSVAPFIAYLFTAILFFTRYIMNSNASGET